MVGSFGRFDPAAALTYPAQLAPTCYGEVAHNWRDTAVSVGNMLVPGTIQAIIARGRLASIAERTEDVQRMSTLHSPFLSQPAELAALIRRYLACKRS